MFKEFYDRTRSGKLLGPVLTSSEVTGLEAVLKLCQARGLGVAHTAYILATDYHETAGTMQPICELGGAGYLTRMYDVTGPRKALAIKNGNTSPGDGVKYCGRGLSQITWKGNYQRIGTKIGVDLVNHPLLALRMDVAVQILVDGMTNGWFTGRKLSHTLPSGALGLPAQFTASRPIINSTDKAVLIAGYAMVFQGDLLASGWKL